jgi:hypothetical protein
MTEEVQTLVDQATVDTPAAPSLSIGDLIVLTNLAQAAAQRGAIRADEMEIVGGVYNKLITFLTAAGALKPAEAAPTETPAEAV